MSLKINVKILFLICTTAFTLQSKAAINSPATDASIVELRISCLDTTNEIPNCFDNTSDLENWMNNIRTSSSLLVNIGPGTFIKTNASTAGSVAVLSCRSNNITLKGAGTQHTILKADAANNLAITAGISIDSGCNNFSAQDLTASGWIQGAIVTNLSSHTSWKNILMEGGTYGWLEPATTSCPSMIGKHTWHSSRIVGLGTAFGGSITYNAMCAESWFFATEITALNINNPPSSNNDSSFALEARNAEVHLYGSNARLIVNSGVDVDGATLIRAVNNGNVHIHGSGLDIIHDGSGAVSYLEADASSRIHASSNGFSVHNAGTGQVARFAGTGTIEAPYQWGQNTVPPAITSRNGADTYVETDCQNFGDCSSGGNFPHLMIYRTECSGNSINQGPWYDTVTNACRE